MVQGMGPAIGWDNPNHAGTLSHDCAYMNSDLPILVSGESGTGKSLIAKLLHNFSDRRNLPFVSVGADDLTDLDGPAKVLARAKGGTIVFEEIGDFPQTYRRVLSR